MPRPPNPHPYHKIITRWLDAEGRQVPPNTPGARKVRQETSTYYADIPGVGTRTLGTSDLQLAWKRLNDKLREAHQEQLGIRDEYSKHAKVPLAEHLRRWLEILQAQGTGARQRGLIESRLAILFDLAQWTKLADISQDSALLALAKLKDLKPAKGSKAGRSEQTRNHYITHLKAFCSWCVDSDRLRKNPVKGLEKGRVEGDRRHQRREPTREEIAWLLSYLEQKAPARRGMTGPQRALGYKVAMATGYRANELRTLTPESFDLDKATVSLPARTDKARRGDVHPLPAWLVADLRTWFAAGGDCWGRIPSDCPGRLVQADLGEARAAWIAEAQGEEEKRTREQSAFLAYQTQGPDGPLFWDFHALRVWYVSQLAADPQVDIKTLMRLARHTTPNLSLSVYARHREESTRAATNRLPEPGSPPPENR